jgi:hypothetical protein
MDSSEPLSIIVTVENRTLALSKQRVVGDEQIVRLSVDRNRAVFLSLPCWYSPGLAYGEGRVAIWAGMRIYFYNCETGSLSDFKIDDEVHVVYAIGDRWCLVCELSVVLFDESLGQEIASYQHNEVLMDSWWASGRLFVEDFDGRKLQFDLGPSGSGLEPFEV